MFVKRRKGGLRYGVVDGGGGGGPVIGKSDEACGCEGRGGEGYCWVGDGEGVCVEEEEVREGGGEDGDDVGLVAGRGIVGGCCVVVGGLDDAAGVEGGEDGIAEVGFAVAGGGEEDFHWELAAGFTEHSEGYYYVREIVCSGCCD